MDIKIIDKNLDKQLQEILKRIYRLQSGGTLDSLKEIGANTEKQIGASYVSLKQLAANYLPNEQLAFLLWNLQRREEQIIACFLFPLSINKEKITQLGKNCLNFEIAGYLGSIYLWQHSEIKEIASEWIESGMPFLQTATLTAVARHLIIYKGNSHISETFFHTIINKKYKDKYVQLIAERYRFNI